MRESFVEALKRKYEAEIASAKATAEVYFERPVAIGEHPQFLPYNIRYFVAFLNKIWALEAS